MDLDAYVDQLTAQGLKIKRMRVPLTDDTGETERDLGSEGKKVKIDCESHRMDFYEFYDSSGVIVQRCKPSR